MEEEGSGANRLFVILAVSLIGLLVLGLLGVGGVFVIRQNMAKQESVGRPTPTLIIRLPNPTASPTPVTIATNTPAPTPTNTPVVDPNAKGEEAAVSSGQANPTANPSPTRTPVPQAEEAGVTVVPETGLGGLEIVLISVGLIGVFFVARRLRMAS